MLDPAINDARPDRSPQAALQLQRLVLERIARGCELGGVLDELCRSVERWIPRCVASVILLERGSGSLRLRAAPSLAPEAVEAFDGLDLGPLADSRDVILEDAHTSMRWRDSRPLLERLGIRVHWTCPIQSAQGVLLGSFGVACSERREPDVAEVELLETASNLVSIALDRERADREVRERDERYRALLGAIPDALFRIDKSGLLLDVVPSEGLSLLPDVRGAGGIRLADAFPPEAAAAFRAHMARAAASGETELFRYSNVARDGERHYEVSLRASGPAEAIAVVRDVTVRHRAQEALRLKDIYYRTILENAFEGIAIVDGAGKLLLYEHNGSPGAFRWSNEEIAGRNAFELVHPEDVQAARDLFARLLERSGSTVLSLTRNLGKDGSWRWFEARSVNLLDHPAVGGVVSNFRDVTERMEGEREREVLEKRLREDHELKAVGTLASGLAHDFNNLLTAIYGSLDMAALEIDSSHSAARHLETIRKASQQASGVCRALLAFARKSSPERADVELTKLVRDSCSVLRHLLPASIEVELEVGAEPVLVRADPSLLQQALINLTINARDAMPEGGTISIRVDRGTSAQQEEALLTVEDRGIGMSDEVLGRIFEPFFTTKSRSEGTGLGLAMVHGVVAQHGGRIEVDSKPGKGSRFVLHFPLARPAGVASDEPAPLPATRGHSRLPILLAEDDDLVRELLLSTLRRAGYEAEAVADGESALQSLLSREHALAILDLDLPRRSGYSCLQDLRRRGQALPVVVISGNIDSYWNALREEGVRVLQKPFRMDKLLHTVSACLTKESTGPAPR